MFVAGTGDGAVADEAGAVAVKGEAGEWSAAAVTVMVRCGGGGRVGVAGSGRVTETLGTDDTVTEGRGSREGVVVGARVERTIMPGVAVKVGADVTTTVTNQGEGVRVAAAISGGSWQAERQQETRQRIQPTVNGR